MSPYPQFAAPSIWESRGANAGRPPNRFSGSVQQFSRTDAPRRVYARAVAPPQSDELGRLLHALRQPLGAFVNYLSLLEDENVREEARKYLDAMRADVKRMTAAIEQIAAALEAGDSTTLFTIRPRPPGSQRIGG